VDCALQRALQTREAGDKKGDYRGIGRGFYILIKFFEKMSKTVEKTLRKS
jgi:hypothetical protein